MSESRKGEKKDPFYGKTGAQHPKFGIKGAKPYYLGYNWECINEWINVLCLPKRCCIVFKS